MADRDLVQHRIAGLGRGPRQDRGSLHHVHFGFANADAVCLFELRAQREDLGMCIFVRRERSGSRYRQFAGDRVIAENRSDRGAIVEGQSARGGLRMDTRAESRRAFLGEACCVTNVAARRGGQPEHLLPVAIGPIARGSERPCIHPSADRHNGKAIARDRSDLINLRAHSRNDARPCLIGHGQRFRPVRSNDSRGRRGPNHPR
jgi:hypothetical protein